MDSQLGKLLAELPGVDSDPADGVVAEVKLLQSQQAIQPPLLHVCQVVVVQMPGGSREGTAIRLFVICEEEELKKTRALLSACGRGLPYRTSMLLRPQKAPSIRQLRPFRCILSERRACRPWNVKPSTRRTRFLLSSLQHTQGQRKCSQCAICKHTQRYRTPFFIIYYFSACFKRDKVSIKEHMYQ